MQFPFLKGKIFSTNKLLFRAVSLCFSISNHSVVGKLVMLESKEEILNIFTRLDEKEIFLELKNFFVGDIQDLRHLDVIFRRSSTSGSKLGQSFLLGSEHSLDVEPLLVVFSGLVLADSFSDVIDIIDVGTVEFTEVLLEIDWVWLADGLGLLDEVVLDILSAVQVSFVGSLVHGNLVVSLVVDSFSHVLVLLHSNNLLDVLFDELEQVDVSLFLDVLIVRVDLSLELVLDVEQLTNVFLTDFLESLVHVTFNVLFVTNLVGLWEDAGAYLLGKRRECSTWTN